MLSPTTPFPIFHTITIEPPSPVKTRAPAVQAGDPVNSRLGRTKRLSLPKLKDTALPKTRCDKLKVKKQAQEISISVPRLAELASGQTLTEKKHKFEWPSIIRPRKLVKKADYLTTTLPAPEKIESSPIGLLP